MSVEPPGAKPTIILTGRVGNCCAHAVWMGSAIAARQSSAACARAHGVVIFMTSDVQSIPPTMDIYYAAGLFMSVKFRRFPVVEHGRIVGAGPGLSASLARLFSREGLTVALAARDTSKLDGLCRETGARAFQCDATRPADVQGLYASVEPAMGAPDVVV